MKRSFQVTNTRKDQQNPNFMCIKPCNKLSCDIGIFGYAKFRMEVEICCIKNNLWWAEYRFWTVEDKSSRESYWTDMCYIVTITCVWYLMLDVLYASKL